MYAVAPLPNRFRLAAEALRASPPYSPVPGVDKICRSAIVSASDSVTDQQLARKRFLFQHVPYVVLYVVALGLVAMTAHDAAGTSIYWQLFIPLIALVSIAGGWRFAGEPGVPRWDYLLKQVLHWGALVLVIRLLYSHDVQDFLNDEQDGFVTIYVTGLAAILSGIYLDWKMAVFGLFMLLSGVAIAWFDDNALLLTLVFSAAAVAVAASLLIRRRVKRARSPG
jgi:hypothetical protein